MSKKIIITIILIIIFVVGGWYFLYKKPAIAPGPQPTEQEKVCLDSGGTITTGICCKSTGDFPNTCLIGACGCSLGNSKEVKICDCGDGCWDGTKCVQNLVEFCGTSTNGQCAVDSDCIEGGCSGQVCQSKNEEPVITTCEYRDCYNAENYGKVCGCIDNKCQWH